VAGVVFAAIRYEGPEVFYDFDVAAFVILASIVAHGLADTVAGGWIERRMTNDR
jgi:hypothetical protein